jgi:hypothetical protein
VVNGRGEIKDMDEIRTEEERDWQRLGIESPCLEFELMGLLGGCGG